MAATLATKFESSCLVLKPRISWNVLINRTRTPSTTAGDVLIYNSCCLIIKSYYSTKTITLVLFVPSFCSVKQPRPVIPLDSLEWYDPKA